MVLSGSAGLFDRHGPCGGTSLRHQPGQKWWPRLRVRRALSGNRSHEHQHRPPWLHQGHRQRRSCHHHGLGGKQAIIVSLHLAILQTHLSPQCMNLSASLTHTFSSSCTHSVIDCGPQEQGTPWGEGLSLSSACPQVWKCQTALWLIVPTPPPRDLEGSVTIIL